MLKYIILGGIIGILIDSFIIYMNRKSIKENNENEIAIYATTSLIVIICCLLFTFLFHMLNIESLTDKKVIDLTNKTYDTMLYDEEKTIIVDNYAYFIDDIISTTGEDFFITVNSYETNLDHKKRESAVLTVGENINEKKLNLILENNNTYLFYSNKDNKNQYCTECGFKVKNRNLYCTNCGNRINNE